MTERPTATRSRTLEPLAGLLDGERRVAARWGDARLSLPLGEAPEASPLACRRREERRVSTIGGCLFDCALPMSGAANGRLPTTLPLIGGKRKMSHSIG